MLKTGRKTTRFARNKRVKQILGEKTYARWNPLRRAWYLYKVNYRLQLAG